jgi:threonine/homoserine/homoserine lactone efflux protein
MITAILVGFMSGWLISMPIGPVNAAAITRTIQFNNRHGFLVGLGAAIMDAIYCAGATQINAFLLNSPLINLCFQSVGFGILLFIGIKSLRAEQQPHPFEPTEKDTKQEEKAEARMGKMHLKQAGYFGSFFLGVVLYASNVSGVPEWVFISAFWHNQGVPITGLPNAALFAIAAGIGTAGWFFTLTRFFSKRTSTLKPRTLHIINRVAGYAMLAFGVYFGYQIIFNTNWTRVNQRLDEEFKKKSSMIWENSSPIRENS